MRAPPPRRRPRSAVRSWHAAPWPRLAPGPRAPLGTPSLRADRGRARRAGGGAVLARSAGGVGRRAPPGLRHPRGRGVARAAWQLFYDHFLVGDTAVAGGWLERARHHAGQAASVVETGFVAVADADRAAAAGDLEAAVDHGQRALDAGRAAGSPDLTAMALQTQGRMLVAVGRSDEGMAMLDEAMLAAVNGELAPLFTGWVYCNVLSTCHDLADLRRAGEWNDAAMRWCDQLRDGAFYPGICRLHVVELACLRGAWQTAEAEARRACGELTAHDPRFAGEAYYLAGEMRRLVGDLDGAQEAFTQAHQLGRLPQPGLARVRLAQGRPEAAAKALRRALDPGPSSSRSRAQLLAARVEAELGVDDRRAARAAAGELASIAASVEGPFLAAMAAAAEGAILLAEGDVDAALVRSRHALTVFRQLQLPYEAALAQVCLGRVARGAGDEDSAALELRAALAAFEASERGPTLSVCERCWRRRRRRPTARRPRPRSRPASWRCCAGSPPARPTARSPPPCSSASTPWPATSATPWPSSASALALAPPPTPSATGSSEGDHVRGRV
jgi:tetratricopeptide (TPR) repeat protein